MSNKENSQMTFLEIQGAQQTHIKQLKLALDKIDETYKAIKSSDDIEFIMDKIIELENIRKIVFTTVSLIIDLNSEIFNINHTATEKIQPQRLSVHKIKATENYNLAKNCILYANQQITLANKKLQKLRKTKQTANNALEAATLIRKPQVNLKNVDRTYHFPGFNGTVKGMSNKNKLIKKKGSKKVKNKKKKKKSKRKKSKQ